MLVDKLRYKLGDITELTRSLETINLWIKKLENDKIIVMDLVCYELKNQDNEEKNNEIIREGYFRCKDIYATQGNMPIDSMRFLTTGFHLGTMEKLREITLSKIDALKLECKVLLEEVGKELEKE